MHQTWTDQFSEYLDGDLGAAEREALEAHLQTCAECRQVLAELSEVAGAAKRLTPRPPTADLWPGIAARIRAESVIPLRPRRQILMPQAIAAGIGLLLMGAGGAWWLRGVTDGPRGAIAVAPTTVDAPALQQVGNRVRTTEAAITELEGILARDGGQLDSTTVRIVTRNLTIINQAIADAERALATDPANPYIRRHLASATKRKIELLRRTAELATAQS